MNWQELVKRIPASNELAAYLRTQLVDFSEGIRAGIGQAIAMAYQVGFQGCFCLSADAPQWSRDIAQYELDKLRESIGKEKWTVEDVFPATLSGSGRGQRAVNHAYTMKMLPRAYQGSQDYGNCTAWAARDGTMSIAGMEIAAGNLKRLELRHGTALVYGSRGHAGAGMGVARGCNVLVAVGQSEEKDYGGGIDLSTERKDEAAGHRWGASGPPRALADAVHGDQLIKAWAITEPTADLVRDVLHSGAVIQTGSTLTAGGEGDPISPLSRIGGHAQCTTLYDDTDELRRWYRERTGKALADGEYVVGTHQTWGDWLQVRNWPDHLWGPRPEGMWVCTISNYLRLLRDWGQGFATTGLLGFTARALPHWGTVFYL